MLEVEEEELVLEAELEELVELAEDELLCSEVVVVAAVSVLVSDAADAEAVSVGSDPTPTNPSTPLSVARTLIMRFACLL